MSGSNAFRISLEWSRITPQRGQVDEEAVRHYHKIFDKIDECVLTTTACQRSVRRQSGMSGHMSYDPVHCRCRCGMEANVTLHWFVHPLWFQEIGGFTKEENIAVFVEWAELAFKLFGMRGAASVPAEFGSRQLIEPSCCEDHCNSAPRLLCAQASARSCG